MIDTQVSPSQALDWLCGAAFPLWLKHGVDWKNGAFHEELDPDTLAPRVAFRRLRVAARQVYSFAAAARMGIARADEAVALGVDFLRHHARQADGGYATLFNLSNVPIDPTRDLYDHAFVLLAFAHAGERAAASELMAYIETQFRHELEGFHESGPRRLPRRQNPPLQLLLLLAD